MALRGGRAANHLRVDRARAGGQRGGWVSPPAPVIARISPQDLDLGPPMVWIEVLTELQGRVATEDGRR